ncbi:MAG: VOC family protein [Pseudomonadota bacterium]|nr:VOC family protein [Pseudomonadota bacterium]
MSGNTGKFVWCEWMGADLPRAVEFYRHVVGWNIAETGMAGFAYQIASVGEYGVGGLLQTPPEAKGAPPCWTGYIYVENVDAAVEKLKAAGGGVLRPPMDIPNVGRMAIVADPQGAPFALFKDAGGNPPAPPPPETPGLVGWRELHARDGKAAFDFYASQFGWKEERQFDMGPMGVYRIFDNGSEQGGMMSKTPEGPGPCWLYYFIVEAAGAAVARVTEKGGKLLHGPHEVPGGMWAAQCADPEGAMFGLVAAKK